MPRIFKGTETLLKLFVPRVDEGNLETLKIGLFTDDTNNAAEFYGDNMSIDGDTVYLKVNAWSFDSMNDGVLNYIAEIGIGEETIITERQSNYFLKTPNQYVPVGPDLSDYYTKPEIDEMLEDIEVDVDLTGYATEQWVEDKTYATEQYVNDAIANIDIPEGGSGEQEVYIEELAEQIPSEQFNRIYELSQSGKIVLAKYDGGIYPISPLDYVNINQKYFSFFATKAEALFYVVYSQPYTDYSKCSRHKILKNGKAYNFLYLNNGRLSKFALDDVNDSLIPVIWGDDKLIPLNLDKKNQIASAIIGDKLYKWDFANSEIIDAYCSPEIIPLTGGGSGDADLSNYYTKEETDNLIANSSVWLETTADGVLTYSQINGIRNNWVNAYIKAHWQENNVTMGKQVAVTSLYIYDILSNNKDIHLEGICEGYLYTWDIKGNNTEGLLVRTPISASGAAKAIVVETEKLSNNAYTDKLAYSKLAIIQENIGNVYIRGNLNTESTDINDAVVTNITYHPMFDMLGVGTCKVTAMNATNVYTWTFTNKTTQVSPTITPIASGGGSTPSTDSDCVVIQYVGDYTVDYDGEEVEYNYQGSERQTQNIDAIQRILSGEVKAVYYQYLHEQVYRTDEDGYNNKPTWLMMPMVYRYPSHDNIARFMGVINKDEWGGTNTLYAVGIMLNESDASIYNYNESQIETGSGGSTTSDSCVYYYGSTLRGDEVWSNYENGKLQYVGFSGVDNNGKIIEGSFPLSINSVEEEAFTATGFLDESTFVKWDLMAYDSEDIEGNISTSGAVVIEVSTTMGLTNDMAKTIFDNMGNVAIAIRPALFGTVNTKYNVTHCVYRATPSTLMSTIVTVMNGTELYQWTITSNGEEYTPTKKTLTFA